MFARECYTNFRYKIARNSFPKPQAPTVPDEIDIVSASPSQVNTIPTIPAEASTITEPDTQVTTGNTPPTFSQDQALSPSSPKMPPPPIVPAFPSPPPAPLVKEATPPLPEALDSEDEILLASLSNILTTQFDAAPPYTIQRLSELIRYPNAHYKSLSKYLRAIQRVLSVSSPTTAFPLPPSVVESMPNGAASFNLGSDESLGGALLSPIPWLAESPLTEGTEGVNGVSQGELLRQEQELNIVPAAQVSSPPEAGMHAEGPPALGPEDVGPQPEGTVFPDPPATIEEARSPRHASMGGKEEGMGDAVESAGKEGVKDGEGEVREAKAKDEMEKVAEGGEAQVEIDGGKQQPENKKDMDLDTKEPEPPKGPIATESSEMMQLDTPTPDTKTTPPATEKNPEGGDAGTTS
ncbi:unnamed protein product [Tuber melanosporum]|uniref:(Perigord truffle) hypothetical protein n=1 Tax=Tuber melanosporum (strain Mel28) TaxID=656061 RepID=D5GJ75_TUBMM|nr:uncharacterized protein GSTUM_00008871001 [Tuber melanosporum]CAZ84568.1 unnamed protein product [Tuber melanosporum]